MMPTFFTGFQLCRIMGNDNSNLFPQGSETMGKTSFIKVVS
jgi:hypothetical protein